MFERFDERARRVVVLAQEEARLLDHNYIGTEHILLGLLRGGEGVAVQVLVKRGADLNQVRQQVIQLLHAGQRVGRPSGTYPMQHADVADRLDAIERRLSSLEQRVGAGPDLRDFDREIDQARRDKEVAIDAQDFESAVALRDRERQLLAEKAAREEEQAALPSLSEEIERLRELLRRHGIGPQDGGVAEG